MGLELCNIAQLMAEKPVNTMVLIWKRCLRDLRHRMIFLYQMVAFDQGAEIVLFCGGDWWVLLDNNIGRLSVGRRRVNEEWWSSHTTLAHTEDTIATATHFYGSKINAWLACYLLLYLLLVRLYRRILLTTTIPHHTQPLSCVTLAWFLYPFTDSFFPKWKTSEVIIQTWVV